MAFDLKSISKSGNNYPPRILIYGAEGIGKSTFAAGAPNPIFVPTEDGLSGLEVASFPLATSYQDVLKAMEALYIEKHDYKTVVIDSVDWLETLIWRHVAKEGGVDSIEAFGYGKGYVHAADALRECLTGLNALRTEKGMGVILLAHSQVKRFDDPTTDPYDRYTLKLHAKASALAMEWVDIIGFATQQIIIKKEDKGFNQKTSRGIAMGDRVLCTARTPAYDAKSRYSLPATIPFAYNAFADALKKEK